MTASTMSLSSPIRPDREQATEGLVVLLGVHRGLDDAGETALARMPRPAYSMARDLVADCTPPLVSDASTEGCWSWRCRPGWKGDVDDVAAALGEHVRDDKLRRAEETRPGSHRSWRRTRLPCSR